MRIKLFGREILAIESETKVTEPKLPELKLRTPKDKVQPMAQFTKAGYPTGTVAQGIGHAKDAVQAILHGGESRNEWETALFLMYLNGQTEEIEKGLNFIEISKVRSFVLAMDDKVTPLPKVEAPKPATYEKPCGCLSTAPMERIMTDGVIRCTKHGSYIYSFNEKKFVPKNKGQLGDLPSGRSGYFG